MTHKQNFTSAFAALTTSLHCVSVMLILIVVRQTPCDFAGWRRVSWSVSHASHSWFIAAHCTQSARWLWLTGTLFMLWWW